VEEISPVKLHNDSTLSRYYAELSDWKWRYGKTPEFEHHLNTRFDWGQFDVHIQCNQGSISEVKIFSDCLNPALVEELQDALIDAPYTRDGIERACKSAMTNLRQADPLNSQIESQIGQFRDWLAEAL